LLGSKFDRDFHVRPQLRQREPRAQQQPAQEPAATTAAAER
jgi:hypothetical protein